MNENRTRFWFKFYFNVILSVLIGIALILNFVKAYPIPQYVFIILSILGILPTIQNALYYLFKKKPSIDLLASIALIFAFIAGEWTSAAFINLMLGFARIFDLWTENKTKNIIKYLLKYRPERVKIKLGDEIIEKHVDDIRVGDLVVVGAGERIAVDGEVVSGQASVNQSVLTGESEPITKKVGDKVFASTLNESGSLLVKTEKIGEDSSFSKIIKLVEEATRKKSVVERIADKFTIAYVIIMLVGSIVLFIVLQDVKMVLAFLLVICADDLAVAIPLTFTTAISRAAKRGVLLKGSTVLEKMTKLKTFITDKTGTLTYGKPEIKEIVTFAGFDKRKLLEYFGMAQINSQHPISLAIIKYLKQNKIKITAPDKFDEYPGEGISVQKGNNKILAGKISFLRERKIEFFEAEEKTLDEFKNKGFSITALSMNRRLAGAIVSEDKVRPYAKRLIEVTKDLGVSNWVMLTGDNDRVARKVSSEIGIDEFKANLKPQDKLNYIENYKHIHRKTFGMIGDGVNDAAALTMADVSIAMGQIGSDAAIEAADITLMHDSLRQIPAVMVLGKKTMSIVKQNFLIWGITNALGLILVSVHVIGPEGAAAYNFATDFFPIINSLRVFMPSSKEMLEE